MRSRQGGNTGRRRQDLGSHSSRREESGVYGLVRGIRPLARLLKTEARRVSASLSSARIRVSPRRHRGEGGRGGVLR
ncbi:MAG: hypothetical protein BWY17_02921 [Deltaproteobacteria bacterium ADurb.Bin207]|nr:MAG: hypothetical protein BWY17_02921 [Deltaproteobacteria bacterium ADurb.Bin207]